MRTNMAAIELKHVFKKYDDKVTAVNDFNLTIEDKEFVVFVGPSGCGKSTTLRMIAGLEEISSGELWMDGQIMNQVKPNKRNVAMVFQNYALYPHMTVFGNIAYSMKLKHITKKEMQKKVSEVAKILDIETILDRKPKELSGGQKQRVAIGRAMVRNPRVFLMDEPLSNLDAKLRNKMRAEIHHLYQMLKTTFIYVTHDQTEAMTLGTKIVVMKDGIVQQVASAEELYRNPANVFVAQFIGSPQMNLLHGKIFYRDKKYFLMVHDHRIDLPKEKGEKLEQKDYIGKKVFVGVRPEDVEILDMSRGGDGLKMNVEAQELLGVQTNLFLKRKNTHIAVVVKGRSDRVIGSECAICLDADKIHLFDIDTEKNILK